MQNLLLLLVEDNMDDEWLALRALRKVGLDKVTVVRDGYSAMALLNSRAPMGDWFKPDLVLLDMKLPLMNGIEVLRAVRAEERTSSLNVVLLTSSEDPHGLEACRELGVLACLQKPLSIDSLMPVLQALTPQGKVQPLEPRIPRNPRPVMSSSPARKLILPPP